MSYYIEEFESVVAGIPCRVGVLAYHPGVAARYSYSTGNMYDVGPAEPAWVEYDILDRNGRKAEWLERKMNDYDKERVESEAKELFQ